MRYKANTESIERNTILLNYIFVLPKPHAKYPPPLSNDPLIQVRCHMKRFDLLLQTPSYLVDCQAALVIFPQAAAASLEHHQRKYDYLYPQRLPILVMSLYPLWPDPVAMLPGW